MHIAHLARAENELLASPLEDELRFVHREHVRGAVVLLRQLLLPLHHFARKANDHVVLIGLSVNRDGSECRAFDLHSLTLVLFPILRDTLNGMRAMPSLHRRRGAHFSADRWRRAQTPFERALHVRTTPFASVGDILKAVGEEDRGDFRYCHLASAIRTDFRSGHYGTCQLCAHDVSFRPTKCRGERKGSPWIGCLSV